VKPFERSPAARLRSAPGSPGACIAPAGEAEQKLQGRGQVPWSLVREEGAEAKQTAMRKGQRARAAGSALERGGRARRRGTCRTSTRITGQASPLQPLKSSWPCGGQVGVERQEPGSNRRVTSCKSSNASGGTRSPLLSSLLASCRTAAASADPPSVHKVTYIDEAKKHQ
jgi:hypothetical protein